MSSKWAGITTLDQDRVGPRWAWIWMGCGQVGMGSGWGDFKMGPGWNGIRMVGCDQEGGVGVWPG